MRILIIHCGYPLNHAGGEGVRTMNMAKSLSSLGHKVYILMLYNILNISLKDFRFLRKTDDVMQIQIPTFPTSRFLSIALFYNRIIVLLVSLLTRAQAIQAEVTWSASTTHFVRRVPLITDFHSDLVPELEALNRSSAFIQKSKRDNVYALKHSYGIFTVSKTLHKNLCETYNASYPIRILPCNVDFKVFTKDRLKARVKLREELGLNKKIVLSYLGGTHKWQHIGETLDIFIRLKKIDSRYHFCLFTQGDLTPFISKIDEIKDSFTTKALSPDVLVEYLSIIDAGFVIRDNLLLNANSSPTKTGEYMAVGAMVIATRYAGDAPELINDSGYGYVLESIKPADKEIMALHQKIIEYVDDYENNANKIRDYIAYSRDWMRNEEMLNMIYSELDVKC